MPAFLFFVGIAWVVTAAGRQLAVWLRLPNGALGLERHLIGFAVGLGLLSYGMMALGLLGVLYPGAAAAWLVALGLLGARQHGPLASDINQFLRHGRSLSRPAWGGVGVIALFFGVSAVGVYTPPTSLEWDSLAYHLADPKQYVQAHRIFYIPWEDHSNFAFNTEMCYTLGLLFGSVPLAKWFHWACGVGTVLAVFCLGRRFLSPRVGGLGAVLFGSVPLVFWEAGTAYVDLATTFYTTLTLLAVARGVAARSRPWLGMGAVLLGLTLATKGTALSTLGLLGLGLLWWQWRAGVGAGRSLGRVAAWGALALLVGAPWYVKSWALTGNPLYPFFFFLFGGRYWGADNAAGYDVWNASFGVGRSPLDALLAPYALTMNLLPGHAVAEKHDAFNDYQTELMALTPVLLAALFLPVFHRGPVPRAVRALSVYALGALALWFVTAQHVRYLLPVLPVLCLLAAWALDQALGSRRVSGYALAGLAACSLAFSGFVGVKLLALELPVVTGRVSPSDFITSQNPDYPAIVFVNTQLPPYSKVAFYNNLFGFYCDRPYLWGDQERSLFIPYESCRTPDDLRRALRRRGVTHLFINTNNFHPPAGRPYVAQVFALAAACGPPLYISPNGRIFVYALPPGGG